MLGILLMIVKIIGIILLCILGLFLALILLVLFVPVPYRIYVNGDSGDSKNLEFCVKIFGVQVFPKKASSGNARRPRRKKRIKEQEQDSPGAEAPQIQAEESQEKCQAAVELHRTEGRTEQKGQKKQTHLKAKNKNAKAKNKRAENASSSGRDVRGMLKLFYAEFTDEGNRRALRHLLSEIHYLLRHFGPRRVRADACFSLGDPANTGYATAAFSMCPFSYGKGCRILPDFEAEQWYVRGWLDMRGHARAVHVLIAGLRLLLDKNVRRIIGKILKKK